MEKDAKILLKITDTETKTSRWIHLCYADETVYNDYILQNPDSSYMNEVLSRWCKEDFNQDLSMNSIEDVATLKGLVKELYREKYPEVYRDSDTDRQGWLRLWVTSKMKEELDGKQSF